VSGVGILFILGSLYVSAAPLDQHPFSILVQVPYQDPPKPTFPKIQQPTPAPTVLTQQDSERLTALIPLLSGRQELWAMGEFVHFGKLSVPFLIKALTMPGPRLRYNAIETLSIINDPSAIHALVKTALNKLEMTRVRDHAIRVAVKLEPVTVLPALKLLTKDPNSTIRNEVAFISRRIRKKEVLPIIIELIPDAEQYVSITARDSFWALTGFSGSPHDWEASTQEARELWAKEWRAWWEANKHKFDAPASHGKGQGAP